MTLVDSCLRASVLIAAAGVFGGLHAAPTITQQPQATVIVTSGQSATFTADAAGVGTLRWQWRRMGGTLAGQTGRTLTLPKATMAEVGFYDVVVSDDTGSVTSRPSRLLVTPVGGYPDTLRLDTSFNPTFERNGAYTHGVIAASDGSVYLFGSFSHIAGKPVAGIARFTPDLVIDPTFRPAVSGSVWAAAIQADGKLVLDARVRLADGQLMGPLVRLHTDGSYDPTFNLAALTDWSNAPQLLAHAALPDGKLLIGGRFETVGSLERKALARLNSDGSVDPTFRPDLGLNPSVSSLLVVGDKIVVAGYFVLPGRATAQRVVRLNSDGSIDLSFGHSSLLRGVANAMTADAMGRLYIGAYFDAGSYPKEATVVRLLLDGSIDPTYQCELETTPSFLSAFPDGRVAVVYLPDESKMFGCLDVDGSVLFSERFATEYGSELPRGVAARPDGEFYVGGASTAANSPFRGGAARFSAEGELSASVAQEIRSAGIPEYALPAPGGKWVVAGKFDYANGSPAPGVARLNADGTTDTTFNPASVGLPAVADLVTQGDGAILAVGGGQTVARRLLPSGQLDPLFAFNAGTGFGSSAPGNMAVLADGRIAASGWISSYNGETLNTGLIVIGADGARETAFAPIFRTTSLPFNRLVAAPNGGFAFSGDLRLEGFLVGLLWMTPEGSWIYPHSLGQDLSVYGVGFDVSGRLLAARSYAALRRVDGDGSVVPPGPNPALLSVSFSGAGIAAQTDNRVLIEGSWRPSGGGIAHGPLVRLNADDSLDTTFRLVDLAGTSTPLPRATMQYTDDGRLLVCGGYGVRGGVVTNGMAMFKPEALPPPPVITRQPVGTSVSLGEFVVLSVEATGEIVNYRWYKNGSPKAVGRTLVLPAVAAADFGSYTAEVLGPAEAVKSVTVQVSQRLTQAFATWIAASAAPVDQRGALDSPAGDGVPNLVKYALGVAPMDNSGTQLPALTLVEASGQPPALALIFAKNPQAEGIRYALEISTDLVAWTEVASVADAAGTNAAGAELVRLRESTPIGGVRRFVRLAVVTATP
jgi:uncharacterized delta-60 repeat protein